MDGIGLVVSRPGGVQQVLAMAWPADCPVADEPVSCLMVTRGDRPSARLAIECYRRQTHGSRELVIVSGHDDTPLERHVAALGDPTIRFHHVEPAPLGALRNRAVEFAGGGVFCQWDDDDLCHPDRIALQLAGLADPAVAASTMLRWTLWAPIARRLAVSSRRQWEGSLMIRREAQAAYPPLAIGEDFALVAELRERHPIAAIDAPWAYVYVAHGANTCGAWHFRGLFDAATEVVPPDGYDARLAALGAEMPVTEYLDAGW